MYDYNQSQKPPRDEPTIKLYELVCSLVESLTLDIASLTLRDGSGQKFNGYIDELIRLTSDLSLNDFKLHIIETVGGKPYVMGEAYVRNLVGSMKYLHKTNAAIKYYCAEPSEQRLTSSSPIGHGSTSTTVNNHLNAEQYSSQTQTVQIEFTQTIVTLTEALTNLEHNFPNENSKENKFAKALKKALPAAKDTLGIVAVVLKIASEIGLDPQTVLISLGLK